MKKYVAYYRQSTQKQAMSNLGLSAQKTMVSNYINNNEGELISSFTEIETGTAKKKRVEIYNAIEYAKMHGACLIIANISRLARNVHFVSGLMNSGVEFVCCDMPMANNLTIYIMSALAEEEAKLISSRTRLALAEKKKIMKLGTPANLTNNDRLKGVQIRKQKALSNPNNIKSTALIVEYRSKGLSYDKIAVKLNELGFTTSQGKHHNSTSVKRLHDKITH
jgi:DNA invertase Pin-like site-specific DNA recombinase